MLILLHTLKTPSSLLRYCPYTKFIECPILLYQKKSGVALQTESVRIGAQQRELNHVASNFDVNKSNLLREHGVLKTNEYESLARMQKGHPDNAYFKVCDKIPSVWLPKILSLQLRIIVCSTFITDEHEIPVISCSGSMYATSSCQTSNTKCFLQNNFHIFEMSFLANPTDFIIVLGICPDYFVT